MKSFLSSLLGIFVVLILAAVVIGFVGWSRVPDIVSNTLSKELRVSVLIDAIRLRLGLITISQLEIGNPKGSTLPRAFSAQTIESHAPILNYLKDRIVIDEIDVNDIYLGLEFDSAKGTTGNWTEIMNNLKQAQDEAVSQGKGLEREVHIERLVFNNLDVEVYYRKEGGSIKKLPRIEQIVLTNIDSKGGVPMDQLTSSVLGQMLTSVFIRQNLNNMIEGIFKGPVDTLQRLNPFKLFSPPTEP